MSNYKNNNFPRANREIRVNEVRLVDENGEMVGVVSLFQALERAKSASLDLVEISPNAVPPVCKILDFGKYKYQTKKRSQDAKKKQKTVSLKEVKFRPNIGDGDFDVKVRNIKKFVDDGDKVKVSLWFKGREIVHNEIGINLFNKIVEKLGDEVKIEVAPKMEGKQVIMIVAPLQSNANT